MKTKKTLFLVSRNIHQGVLALVTGCLLFGMAGVSMGAEPLVIDLFTEPANGEQEVKDNLNGEGILSPEATSSTTTGLTSILGGQRDVQVDAIFGALDINVDEICNGADLCTAMDVFGGKLSFSNQPGVGGRGLLQWDGDDESIDLDPIGLRIDGVGVDLTASGFATGFEFTIVRADLGFQFRIEAYTDASHFTKFELASSGVTMPTTRFIEFAVFEDPALCGTSDPDAGIISVECGPDDQTVDFTNLGAAQVLLNTGMPAQDDLDMQISQIIVPREDEPLGCRLTGGGVTEDYTEEGIMYLKSTGMPAAEGEEELLNGETNRYQMHGQAGARTALSPQPWGEWSHTQQSGPAGKFVFHAGTRSAPSAPVGTEIVEIRCSDPGGCGPSGNPPSPLKQLDFDCIGTFKSIGKGGNAPEWLNGSFTPNATDEGNGNKTFDGTFHWCEVNVDDLGEGPDGPTAPEACPVDGFGEKGDPTVPANCDCPDFYRLTIYNGVNAADVEFLDDGSIDPESLDRENVIYEVDNYLLNGNGLQIHDLTGFDK